MARSLVLNGLTETMEYANVEEANKHIDNIRSMVRAFGFGRVEEFVTGGEPTQVSVRLDFKLKKVKKP